MMRACMLALVAVVAFTTVGRADEERKGSIGVMIKLDEDKVVVVDVFADSPADKAGLKKEDVIIKVNDVAADNLENTVKEITRHKPGTKIKVIVKREGKEKTVEVEVGKPIGA